MVVDEEARLTEEQWKTLEQIGTGLAILLIFVCTIGAPAMNHGLSKEQLAKAYARSNRHVMQLQASLQTAQGHIESQKADLIQANSSFEKTKERLEALQKERDTLKGLVDEGAAKVKDIQSQLQTAQVELAKLKNQIAKDDTVKQRDEALARATRAEDRVRELTLQLHRAGIWP
jgi:peptidoglycan hydrolase CwlO-like protein